MSLARKEEDEKGLLIGGGGGGVTEFIFFLRGVVLIKWGKLVRGEAP